MKYIDETQGMRDADSSDDVADNSASIEQRLAEIQQQIVELPAGHSATDKAILQIEAAAALVGLGRGEEAWDYGRQAFDVFIAEGNWEKATYACDILFSTDQDGSLAALGMGIWLSVTYPIDPELSVVMLEHVVDETPDDADGAAVAATVALYLVDIRAEGKQLENLSFYTNNLLGRVARRHQDIETQEQFDFWLQKMELDDPAKFLPRLRNVVDVLVQEGWWFDREALQAKLPVN